jgi:hypothetical protein
MRTERQGGYLDTRESDRTWRKIHNEYLYDIHFPPNTEPIFRSRKIRHVHMG